MSMTVTNFGNTNDAIAQHNTIPKGSILIGYDIKCMHDNCILIGSGLVSDREFQIKIGNREVQVSRDLCDDEWNDLMTELRIISQETLFSKMKV